MDVIGYILLGVVMVAVLFMLMVWPGFRRRFRQEPGMRLKNRRYAHRGLHDGEKGIPENSMAAFRNAAEHGFGIELDVQRTADGQIVVFHDRSLKRVCGIDRNVDACTYEELQTYSLCGTGERIPLFSEVLREINGRIPLLVELKHYTARAQLCEQTARLLDGYEGDYMIESFHPAMVLWFRKHRPQVLRGFLSQNFLRHGGIAPAIGVIVGNLLLNFLLAPDFVAYELADRKDLAIRLFRDVFKGQCAYWTIRSEAELRTAEEVGGTPIFEQILPSSPHVKE